jgi:hypothetical protein
MMLKPRVVAVAHGFVCRTQSLRIAFSQERGWRRVSDMDGGAIVANTVVRRGRTDYGGPVDSKIVCNRIV